MIISILSTTNLIMTYIVAGMGFWVYKSTKKKEAKVLTLAFLLFSLPYMAQHLVFYHNITVERTLIYILFLANVIGYILVINALNTIKSK